jgi:toxin ParE1/3/4
VRIIWSSPAQADLAAIHEHYSETAPEHAFAVAVLAVRAGRLLADQPKLGPVIGDTGHRKWRLAKTDHILIYRIEGDRLRIARVVHAAQDWRNLF